MTATRRMFFAVGLVVLGCAGFASAALDAVSDVVPWRRRRGR